MICKYVRFTVIIILVGVMLTALAEAEVQFDSVLGVPWGASPEQARKIMAGNGNSFSDKFTNPISGTPILLFKGSYTGYPAEFRLHFMSGQMWQLRVRISDEEKGLDYAFDTLNKLLTEKYGPQFRDESYNMPVSSLSKPVPVTKYVWNLDADAKRIQLILIKGATFYVDKIKIDGGASVTYENVQLFEALKKKNI